MWAFAGAAVRAYRSSFLGSFLIIVAASALLSATGVLMESGIRGDAPLLTAVAASFGGTAILVVILVVASTFSSALRQREAQFALLRAVGATPAQVRAMVTGEVVIVFAIAAPLGMIPGLFAADPLLPILESGAIVPVGMTLTLSPLPAVAAVLVLLPTALLAARLAARRVTRLSPTQAVRSGAVEASSLSRARRVTALSLLIAGLLAATTPFFVPGTFGSAAGSTSAFLLISAAALAGPAIAAAAARRGVRASRPSRSAATRLALVNARGFSRRLTAAIIPLALLLALGTVQTGVDRAVAAAAGAQVRAGLASDVIATSDGGVTNAHVAAVAADSRTEALMVSSTVVAAVKVDDDADLGGLSWEQTALRSVSGAPLLDPDVTQGSLDDLSRPQSIAVSGESLFGTGKGVGDAIEVRFGDAMAVSRTIVAVYERGIGFGPYIVHDSSVPPEHRPATADAIFARGSVELVAAGLDVLSLDDYIATVVDGARSQQRLGAILLFVLILFIAIGAANTLVMLTAARRSEFFLLRRIGTTGHQLVGMVAIEAVFVVIAAVVIGTGSVLPALIGVSYGMLGELALAIDWPVYGILTAAVASVAATATVIPAMVAGRVRRASR